MHSAGTTLSADLLAKRKPGERIRVIIQGSETGMTSLRGRLRAALRRDLGEGLAVDLSPEEFANLSKDSSVAHLSGDVPVAADMALTNRITKAAEVWQSTSGLLGLFSTSGYNGDGIGVAVVDSGISPHTARHRIVARANFVSWEPDMPGDASGTHPRRRRHRGKRQAASRVRRSSAAAALGRSPR